MSAALRSLALRRARPLAAAALLLAPRRLARHLLRLLRHGSVPRAQVRYINVNAANYDAPNRYSFCNPRVDPSFLAWLGHLIATGTRWLLVSRYPDFEWPAERGWAQPRFVNAAPGHLISACGRTTLRLECSASLCAAAGGSKSQRGG
jgi:hypothetical protein